MMVNKMAREGRRGGHERLLKKMKRAVRVTTTLNPATCTLHPVPCTLHPAPCTLHSVTCAGWIKPCVSMSDLYWRSLKSDGLWHKLRKLKMVCSLYDGWWKSVNTPLQGVGEHHHPAGPAPWLATA